MFVIFVSIVVKYGCYFNGYPCHPFPGFLELRVTLTPIFPVLIEAPYKSFGMQIFIHQQLASQQYGVVCTHFDSIWFIFFKLKSQQ